MSTLIPRPPPSSEVSSRTDGKRAAKVTILPSTRLRWHSQLCEDLGLSNVAVRVAIIIGSHFNNVTGKTFVGYDHIANDLGIGRSTVAAAIKELKEREHLHVKSGGGRAYANGYEMMLKTVQASGRYDAQTVQNPSANRPETWTTTLKLSSKANSKGGSFKKQRKQGKQEAAEKGITSFKIGSENWIAWLAYYEARGDGVRVSLMKSMVAGSRYGEWSETSAWPPDFEHEDTRTVIIRER